ncbi:MAG: Gx transporter family protein [Treponema sp.]|jgi:heptaprenyl diphosphate synthase|nr:Gx transporter family protein [Treponema sp.]
MRQTPWFGREERRNIAILGAFCLFLSSIEYMIPKPLPFMRLGLANIPLMLAIDVFPVSAFALLALLKVTGQAVISGTLFSYVFLFSLVGTASSALVMYALRRALGPKLIGFVGASVSGALVSNASQLVLARVFVFGEGIRFLIPPFLGAGLISGVALGLFCEQFAAHSRWYRQFCRKESVDYTD